MARYKDSVGCRKITLRSERLLDGGSNYYVERYKGKRQTLYKVFFYWIHAINFYTDKLDLMKKYHAKEKRHERRARTKIR